VGVAGSSRAAHGQVQGASPQYVADEQSFTVLQSLFVCTAELAATEASDTAAIQAEAWQVAQVAATEASDTTALQAKHGRLSMSPR